MNTYEKGDKPPANLCLVGFLHPQYGNFYPVQLDSLSTSMEADSVSDNGNLPKPFGVLPRLLEGGNSCDSISP